MYPAISSYFIASDRHSFACRISIGILIVLATLGLPSAEQVSAATRAGETIRNIAKADAMVGNSAEGIASNPADIVVDEILDIDLRSSRDNLVFDAKGGVTAPLVLTNKGNGNEAFIVSLTTSTSKITVVALAIDTDADGIFTPGTDTVIAPGGSTPILTPGSSIALLAVLAGADVQAGETLTVIARSTTKYGQPGAVAPGLGDGGTDAVVGLTGAEATLKLPLSLSPQADALRAAFTKSQTVRAPDGSDRPVRGAVITYTLEANFAGTGVAQAAQLIDPVPPGTVYRPASLRLDGAPLTDAADGDAGTLQGTEVRISLGNVTAPAVHQLSFDVIIQ